MNQYFSIVEATYTPKNNAHKEALVIAGEFNRTIVNKKQVRHFLTSFLNKIKEVNENNPRCNNLELEIDSFHEKPDVKISIHGLFFMMLYKANRKM